MSSMSNPKPWTPYTDCSQGICNIYCPQWCYLILPPPPPSFFNDEENSSSSSSSSSPLLIALIGILATAFILVSYYTLISKYCHHNRDRGGFFSSSNAATGDGLNDSVIKSITVYKYRKEDRFVDGSDCSVCLSEFQENESLRLLPKCNHAFHLPCIDTWLKSHSNCPLCRAFVTGVNSTTTTATESGNRGGGISNIADYQHQSGESVVVIADLEIGSRNVNGRTQSQSQSPEEQGERKDDEDPATIRRSVSLNSGTVVVVSVADVLREIEGDERDGESSGVGTSEQWRDGKTPSLTAANQRSGGVSSFLVRSTVAMKRSVSTGRFIFSSNK